MGRECPRKVKAMNMRFTIRDETVHMAFDMLENHAQPAAAAKAMRERREDVLMSVYTPAKLAERWECHPNRVHTLIKNGTLPAFRLGGKLWRIKAADVEACEALGALPGKCEPCDVYIIKCGTHVKIGKATDTTKRIASLQAANPADLEVVAILTEGDGHKLERELHKRFAQHRFRGEWFNFNGDLAAWVAQGCPL